MEHTYASAGVDIQKAEAFVHRLKQSALRPGHKALWPAAGGYASVVPISDSLAVALTTDGVGTKLLVAVELDKLETIGIDLVAMCANDLICVGATPQSFLDYYATSKLVDRYADAIIDGISQGCDQADMLLVGGETAEVPELYQDKHFDLAGFAMGTVTREQLLTGDDIVPGDAIIGIASSGIHSNGLSLARKVVPQKDWQQLLTPTLIYVKPMMALLQGKRIVKAAAHITGGGWRNLFRLNSKVGFEITDTLPEPPIFGILEKEVREEELFKTFNMGMGFAVIAPQNSADTVVAAFRSHGFQSQQVGRVTDQTGSMQIHRREGSTKSKVLHISN